MHFKDIAIADQKIVYYESGGKGQPVLFVHGNSMSGLCFEKQLKNGLGERYHLVALDLPGHGKSAPSQAPNTAYTLPAYADIVGEFTKILEIENALLVGWSLGGHILLEAIGRLKKSPGLMIFGAPPVGIPMAADAFLPNPLFPLAFKNDLSKEEAVALTSSFFNPGAQIPQFFFDDMKRTDGKAREALGISVGQGNYGDEVKIAANLKKPLAIVQGEQESLVNLAYLKGLNIPALWHNEVKIISNAGHAPHWEQPEKFNSLLAEFIEYCNRG